MCASSESMRARICRTGLPVVHDDFGQATGSASECKKRRVEALPAQTTETEVVLGPGELLSVRWPGDCGTDMWGHLDNGKSYWAYLQEEALAENVTMWFRGRGESKKKQQPHTSQSGYVTYHLKGPEGTVLNWYSRIRGEACRKRGSTKLIPAEYQVFLQSVILGDKTLSKRDPKDPWLQFKQEQEKGLSRKPVRDAGEVSEDEQIIITATVTEVAKKLDPGPEEPQTPAASSASLQAEIITDCPATAGERMKTNFSNLFKKAKKFFEVLWRDLHGTCVFARFRFGGCKRVSKYSVCSCAFTDAMSYYIDRLCIQFQDSSCLRCAFMQS